MRLVEDIKKSHIKIVIGLLLFSAIKLGYGLILGIRETFVAFCNLAPILLAIGILYKKRYLIHFVFFFGVLYQLPWAFDWIAHAAGIQFLNLYEMYYELPTLFLVLSFIQHLFTVPIAGYLLYTNTPENSSPKERVYVPVLLLFVGGIASYQVGYLENANCVHYTCINSLTVYLEGPTYSVIWVGTNIALWYAYWKRIIS